MMSRKWYMKIFRRVCNHSILRIYRNLLRKKMNFVREVQILYHSRRQRRELWRGGQHCFDRDNRIFMQIIFFKKYVFLPFFHLERIIFGGLSSEPRQQGCNHCMLHVHRNILRKNEKWFFRKKYKFYILLGDCKENIAWWSTQPSPRQLDLYADHFFNYPFFSIFSPWAKHFRRPFVKNLSARL